MKYKTRGNADPHGKPRVYFTGHPNDVELYLENITDAILKLHNCAIFYDEDPGNPGDVENFINDLDHMQLIVLAVTRRYVEGDTFAHNTVFQHAMKRHIPILPILCESGIERDFDKKCGDLQYLDPDTKDDTAISFEEKLKKFLDRVLVGDELAAKVRRAFDAYVFLSYRKKDRRYAQKLMRLIHQNPFCRDIAIWYDEFLVPGEDFNDAIRKAMEKSELFALVVTPNLLEDSNYVMRTEYPAARKAGKPILPAMLVPTDEGELAANYENIPTPIDPAKEGALPAALRNALAAVTTPDNNDDPQHIFFIGLAYLGGIDVEVDYELAVRLITRAAEAGLPEAIERLVTMYRIGEGVVRDYHIAIDWQEKLVNLYCRCMEEDNDPQAAKELVVSSMNLGNYCMELPDAVRAKKAYLMSLEACRLIIKMGWDAAKELSELPPNPLLTHEFMQAALWSAAAKEMEPLLPACYDNVGDACREMGRLKEAKSYYKESLHINRDVCGESPSEENLHNLFASLQRLGDLCQRMGDAADAARYYQEMEDLDGKKLSKRDEMIKYNKRGDECFSQNGMTQAEVYFRKSYDIAQGLYDELKNDESREDLSACCGRLAQICWISGRLEEAEMYAWQELNLAKEWQENSESWFADYLVSIGYEHLGIIYMLGDEIRKSENQFLECLTLRRRLYDPKHPNRQILMALVNVCRMLTDLLLAQKRFKAACNCGIEMYDAAREAGAETEMNEAAYSLYRIAEIWLAAAADLIDEMRYGEALEALAEVRELGQFLSKKVSRPIHDDQGQEIPLRYLAAMIQWYLRIAYLNLGDLSRALQAGYRCGNLFTKLWEETGNITYGEYAARSWRTLALLYEEPNDIQLRAYYARQAATVCNELYHKTGDARYLVI